MWDLLPSTVEAVPVVQADMTILSLSEEESVSAAHHQAFVQAIQAREEAGGITKPSYPPVSHVVYGEVPEGYRETMKARPLARGRKYYILVFGEGGFSWVHGSFVA